jgi:hypothetical protein
MKIIPILGLMPYLYLIYQYNSHRAYIILFNGVLYHYNHTSRILRIHDTICNFLIGSYMVLNYSESYLISSFITISFISNNIAYTKYNLNDTLSYIIHVATVQWPTCYEIWRELSV